MIPFLRQVAGHYLQSGEDLSGKCFVFPNRRSMVFFRKYLADAIREDAASSPVIAPEMLTMNEFFFKVSGAEPAGRVALLLELYECYRKLNKNAEPLDDFIFWGDVILADFDDVDKYLADPVKLYANVADFRQLQDTFTYLTDTQRAAIEHFISHFRDGNSLKVNLDSDNPKVKERFLGIWNIMAPLYKAFNKSLEEKKSAYEGMAYRRFAARLSGESAADILPAAFPNTEKYIFVGLNALNECEKTVLRKMKNAGLAEFCWDWSSSMIKDPLNKASMFMSQNVKDFPQAFEPDGGDCGPGPHIEIVSVPSSVGQAKYLPDILRSVADSAAGGDISKVGRLDHNGADTAIVIPDETLLAPILNSIDPAITSINVTMGYPMSGSAIYSLLSDISTMQMHLRKRPDGGWSFYHKQVWSVLSSSIVKYLLDEEGRKLSEKIKTDAKYYIPQDDLSGNWLFDLIFKPVLVEPKTASAARVKEFQDYQLGILAEIGRHISGEKDLALETHFAKEFYQAVNRLRAMELEILPSTYIHLLQQLVGPVAVPFKGEPLRGLQIMGPLETRALDFSNIVLLSCNEGVFPSRNVSSSFIPPELRKGFGLPTYENQDAVWSYYFFRMIQRASNVWLLYDSRTEGLNTGEESRYIKQLEYQFGYKNMTRKVVKKDIRIPEPEQDIPKTEEDLERIRTMHYSASSLQTWLACQAKFYYSSIKKLSPESEVAESLDSGMVGDVLHNTMLALYTGGEALDPGFEMTRENVQKNVKNPLREISADYIDSLLKNEKLVRARIRSLICSSLKCTEVTGRNLVLEDVLMSYVRQVLNADKKLIEKAHRNIRILGLEILETWELDGRKFIGFIDRLDSIEPGVVRVVDYKTGKASEDEVYIDDANAASVAEALFGEDNSKRPKIALQLFLYDRFVEKMKLEYNELENVIYPVPKLFTGDIYASGTSKEFEKLVTEKLRDILAEISDKDKGFKRTGDEKTCGYCDFRKLCGK
ncbi:MAG: PD-(D/E)XK nuclease family protein [Candidatus Cryptobacteroides sp.]